MATDGGQIDYGKYSRDQLEQIRQRMDRERYPLNYQRLVTETARRDAEARAAAAVPPGPGSAAAPPPGPSAAPAGAPVRYRPEFNPDPREYFRIWIVNLALTVA